ncbi:hypothetical protein BCU83_14825 [Vibrio breoganii]|uniref:DUF5710 domain-containing protein n=1 Tax=Vibrio breoganii TaxID=553239 RepID=UPI000C83975E|nr:DUF5710 domain-containing protein [Vibrio breoganii]PMG78003.1 hypothetical protein BCU83_14825 [Vibrio breoganii]
MRMPNARQISEEQQDVFEDAPITGNVLVTGPPGTGKTVIAFLRAQALSRKSTPATVLMYNRVLRRYTENVAKDIQGQVASKTMHSWLPDWWKKHGITRQDEENSVETEQKSDKVYLNSPFSDKDELKAAGGRWDGTQRKWFVSRDAYEADPLTFAKWPEFIPSTSQVKQEDPNRVYLQSTYEERNEVKEAGAKYEPSERKWWVTQEQVNESPEKFEKWLGFGGKLDPPEIKKWHYDWETMLDQYMDLPDEDVIDWGHLIIDEAQDFSPSMFKFLRSAGRCMDKGGITILADENQRLHEGQNSSLDEIRRGLRVKTDREFKLTKNFRNTQPIALMAKHFYTGLPTGVPEIPEKTGSKPKLIATQEQSKQADFIKNFLQFRGAQEVAIIVDSDTDRAFYLDKLAKALPNYRVQYYSSSEPKTSESLAFDKQGVITILNRRSCKGLEFDTVFIPDLQNFSFSDTDLTTFNMNMYVMCSRARSELVLMYVKDRSVKAPILQHLPSESSGLMEYREL